MINQKSNILPIKNVTDTTPKNIASSCLYEILELYKAKTPVTNEVGINNPFTVAFCGFSTIIIPLIPTDFGVLHSSLKLLIDNIQPIKQTITKLITNFFIIITSTQLLAEQFTIVKQKGELNYV